MFAIRYTLTLALIFLPASPFATTFPVTKTADTNDGTCDPDCSLREAIDAANTNPGADDVPVPAGFYLLTLGQLVVSDDVSIAGAGQATTIIDGNATDRVLDIEATSGVVEISGVTIQNGKTFFSGDNGGGIRNSADLRLTNSTVSGNSSAIEGGGIENYEYADLTLTHSTVSGNYSDGYGGGILNYGRNFTITNSTVSGNTAGGGGGGIHSYSYLADWTITNSTVSGNTALDGDGGGIYSSSYLGDFTITNSTVSGNSSVLGDGGGIGGGNFTLTNSTVSGNTALDGDGGGIYGDRFTVTNSTVSGNTADSGGGGIDGYRFTLTNSTVSGNSAYNDSGGIYGRNFTITNSTVSGNSNSSGNYAAGISGSYVTLTNTIVADNGTTTPNCDLGFDSLGYNLTDDDSCGFTAPGDLIVADAMLGPLADNGGPTETRALLAGSPAIDAGSPDCPPPATDQRGVLRPQGAACDIGAFESEATPPGADCLCQVTNINPNTLNLNKVSTGGKQSSINRKMTVQIRTVDAPGAKCDLGETSGPVKINLKMVDDDGDALIDSAKIAVCEGGGGQKQMVRSVFVQPKNCKDSAVPVGTSSGVITATGSSSSFGVSDYVELLTINCNE